MPLRRNTDGVISKSYTIGALIGAIIACYNFRTTDQFDVDAISHNIHPNDD